MASQGTHQDQLILWEVVRSYKHHPLHCDQSDLKIMTKCSHNENTTIYRHTITQVLYRTTICRQIGEVSSKHTNYCGSAAL
ncbi:hypothetical protein E2C01_029745 [Portunus trituberculatus]|uniref:Uncharacterized protein n=1 Tax=Portunus trituberculatus TaxID=210409 RepID=A0A5B7EP57_PORTR|nr:hypothetical protein [Portunus trituberculatus]